jgi:signal peptidase I
VVEKISYNFHEPRRGDIVVLKVPQAGSGLLIKRVIGLPGEKIEIKGGKVYINEQPLEEPYLSSQAQRDMKATVVPPKHVFVMGDNRGFSNDSRSFGPVPLDNIVGRAWFSYWPLDRIGFIE